MVRRRNASRFAADTSALIEMVKSEGRTSLAQIAEGLNERGIPAARGGLWSPTQIARVLKTIARSRIRKIDRPDALEKPI